jgi:hypothetical protein
MSHGPDRTKPRESNRAGVAERAREQGSVRVEHVCQFVSGRVALVPPVVESPPAGQRQNLGVALAEFTGARTVGVWLVEPHRLFFGVEGERRGRGGSTSGPCAMPLLHAADDNASRVIKRAMFTNARA